MTIRASLLSLSLWIGVFVVSSPAKDRCHVYIVDAQKSSDLMQKLEDETLTPEQFKELAAKVETRFEEFEPELGEEELTTKYFEMPEGNHQITASVFYTDESLRLPTEEFALESVMLGIVVSDHKHEHAFGTPGNAVTETAYSKLTVAARVKQRVTFAGLEFLVGMECRFAENYADLSRALGAPTQDENAETPNPPTGTAPQNQPKNP